MYVVRLLWALLVYQMLLLSLTFAELEVEPQQISLKATYDDKIVKRSYQVKNTGSSPVKIFDLKTSCDCTTATISQEIIPSGMTATVDVEFRIGDRMGIQQKQITFKTNDPNQKTGRMSLRVEIPQAITVTPTFLYWRKGSDIQEKTVMIKVLEGEGVQIVPPEEGKQFEHELITTVPGKEFQLKIKPKSLDERITSQFGVIAQYPKDNPKKVLVHTSIK